MEYETIAELAQSAAEEMDTIKLYFERMSRADEKTQKIYAEVIAEEMKHNQQFLERIAELSGIIPEDYETPQEDA